MKVRKSLSPVMHMIVITTSLSGSLLVSFFLRFLYIWQTSQSQATKQDVLAMAGGAVPPAQNNNKEDNEEDDHDPSTATGMAIKKDDKDNVNNANVEDDYN